MRRLIWSLSALVLLLAVTAVRDNRDRNYDNVRRSPTPRPPRSDLLDPDDHVADHPRRIMRRFGVLVSAVVLSACEVVAIPSTTTSDVLPPPDLSGSSTAGPNPTSNPALVATSASQQQHDYTGSLPDGTGYVASLIGAEEERITEIEGGFVLDLGDRVIPIREVSFRVGGGLGSAYSDGTYRANTGEWTIEIRLSDAALGSLGEAAPEIVMGSISTGSRLGMPVLLLDDPFRWDHEQFPVGVVYETFLVRRSCGDLALTCSGNDVVQLIETSALDEGRRAFSASTARVSSLGGRTAPVNLGESPTPR